jgi:RNA polymerase sigma-70 factor (ECF subfamily)
MGGVAEAMAQESDAELAGRARAGDRRAFERLIGRHYDLIHRVAWRHCGDRSEAEDIAQEACIRIARSIGGFEGRSAFSTWCHAVTLNVVRDAMRARARRAAVHAEAGAMAAIAGEGGEEAPSPQEELWAAVRALPERQREAVELVYVEGMSHREAAQIIGCAEATISWHLFAARQKLRALGPRSGA